MPYNRIADLKGQIHNAKVRIKRNGLMGSNNNWKTDLAMVLAGNILERARLDETCTLESVNELWTKTMQFYTDHITRFATLQNRDELQQKALKNDNGKELTMAFRIYLGSLDHIPDNLDARLYPSCYSRIRQLKDRMKQGVFQTIEEKRNALAEYIGARENVGVKHNGFFFADPNLTSILKPTLNETVRTVKADLDKLPDDQIENLFSLGMNYGYGDNMHNAFEDIRRTPFEKEYLRLTNVASNLDIGSDAQKQAVVELLWLKKNMNLPREKQEQLLNSQERLDGVQALKNSPEFARFLDFNDNNDLCELACNQDGNLLEQRMKEAEDSLNSSPFSKLFDNMKKDPQLQQKYQLLFGNLSGNEKLNNLFSKNPATQFGQTTIFELNNLVMELDDKQAFVQNMENLQLFITYSQYLKPSFVENYSKELNAPELTELQNLLHVPKHETALEFEMYLKANIAMNGYSLGGEIDTVYFPMLALHEKVGDAPKWEDKTVSSKDTFVLNGRGDDLRIRANTEYKQDKVMLISEMSEKQARYLLLYGGHKEISKHYQSWCEKQAAAIEKDNNMTPRQYLEERLSFPLKKNILKKKTADKSDIMDAFEEILICRMVADDIARHPELGNSRKSIDKTFEKYTAYKGLTGELNLTANQIASAVFKNDNGKTVTELFRKSLPGNTTHTKLARLNKKDKPTAKAQIEGLQERVKKNKFVNDIERKYAVAQILAIRYEMNIKPGGDRKLNNKVSSEAFGATGDYFNVLNRMPEKDFARLLKKVKEGHGGELVKEFEKLNTYEKYIDNLKNTMTDVSKCTPRTVARIMAVNMQASSKKDGKSHPADVKAIEKIMEVLENEPAFKSMMKDPKTTEFAMKADYHELSGILLRHHNQLESAKKPAPEEKVFKQNSAGPVKGPMN